MDLGLRGRAAFVAASSKGMGRAVAEVFAEEGADVGMCARGEEALRSAAAGIRAKGVRVVDTVADVAVAGDVQRAVDRTVAELGRLDALVVNAAGPPPALFEEIDDSQWQQVFELTFMSAVHLVHAALPALRESDAASITIIESSTIRQPIQGLILSNAIRPGVAGLAKTLASELAPQIRVNMVLPGRIRTDRQIELARAAGVEDLDKHFVTVGEGVPLGRVAEADEVGRVVVFLASRAASYVTGTMLAVDGGLIQVP
ncbi:MAG TPA: SDR family oxidoreductase [Candidatus Dormibacteraeota bacterium]|nr:SDR family oxidoreductase [Candidatus Dormibacteraeota bacterium]